jgi:hypothetical protein
MRGRVQCRDVCCARGGPGDVKCSQPQTMAVKAEEDSRHGTRRALVGRRATVWQWQEQEQGRSGGM